MATTGTRVPRPPGEKPGGRVAAAFFVLDGDGVLDPVALDVEEDDEPLTPGPTSADSAGSETNAAVTEPFWHTELVLPVPETKFTAAHCGRGREWVSLGL